MHGLGRVPQFDPRSLRYPVRSLFRAFPTVTYRYWWDGGAWLDQGETGTCVGHAWAHWIEDSPITHPAEAVDPFGIYRAACLLDPWGENDAGDLGFGTSVLAAAQYLQAAGRLPSYWWAFSLDEMRQALLTTGPGVIGVNWYASMDRPSATGKLSVVEASGLRGGHALVVNGISETRRTFRVKNSWGRGWGKDGRAEISFDDMGRLLDLDGEACFGREVAA